MEWSCHGPGLAPYVRPDSLCVLKRTYPTSWTIESHRRAPIATPPEYEMIELRCIGSDQAGMRRACSYQSSDNTRHLYRGDFSRNCLRQSQGFLLFPGGSSIGICRQAYEWHVSSFVCGESHCKRDSMASRTRGVPQPSSRTLAGSAASSSSSCFGGQPILLGLGKSRDRCRFRMRRNLFSNGSITFLRLSLEKGKASTFTLRCHAL